MSIRKTLALLTINYVCIFFWIFSYRQELLSVLFLFPVTILAVSVNSILLDDRKGIFFWCTNLMAAEAVGIACHSYLIFRDNVNRTFSLFIHAMIELVGAAVVIYVAAFIASLFSEKAAPDRRKRREVRKERKKRAIERDTSPLEAGGNGYEGYDLEEMEEDIAGDYIETDETEDEAAKIGSVVSSDAKLRVDTGDYIKAPSDSDDEVKLKDNDRFIKKN